MKSTVFLTAAVLLLSACASEPMPESGPAADAAVADTAGTDTLSGTWTGDWGPTPTHRNPVTVELAWDGSSLTGTVNPGENAIALSTASYDPATEAITMEAEAQNFRGEAVHYMIEGRVDGSTMTGSWSHDGQQGDFSITMQ